MKVLYEKRYTDLAFLLMWENLTTTNNNNNNIYHYHYCYYLISFKFFGLWLADGLSLETEWQEVSSYNHDSSKYSVFWIVLIHSPISISFNPFLSFLKLFEESHLKLVSLLLMFHSFFSYLARSKYLYLFAFFDFHSVATPRREKDHNKESSFFFVNYHWFWFSDRD